MDHGLKTDYMTRKSLGKTMDLIRKDTWYVIRRGHDSGMENEWASGGV